MRAGLLSQWFDPEPGGGAVPTVLARALAARNHDVRVLTGFPNYPTGRIYPGYRQSLRFCERPFDGVEVRRVPLFASHDQRAVRRSLNYLSFGASARVLGARDLADRDALWVFNSPATVPLVADGLRRRRGVPYLLHIMDIWPDSVLDSGMLASGGAARMADRLLTAIVRRGYEGASRIAVISPGQVDLLMSRGVPSSLLTYCPLWTDEDVFFPRPVDRSLLPAAAADASQVVMYAGALGHVQGLDAAVRAASEVRDTGMHLVLVGSGIAEEGLRALTRELRADNVHFLGRRDPREMGELGAAADVHLVSLADTPLLRVTMPSKLSAVLAMGRPVIMNGAGDAAEVVRESGAGVVADTPGSLAATMREVARCEPAELAAWGRAGRAYYEKQFSVARGVAHVEEMLTSVAR